MKANASNPTDMLAGLVRDKSHSYQDPASGDRRRRVLDEGFDMRIAADGTWFYQGTPINRLPLVKLFASILRREDDGEYWLVTPVERGRVRVEDAPFTAVESVSKTWPRRIRLSRPMRLPSAATQIQESPCLPPVDWMTKCLAFAGGVASCDAGTCASATDDTRITSQLERTCGCLFTLRL